MQVRSLNLSDSFRLASVLIKYVDAKQLSPQADAIEFVNGIVNKLTPQEYLGCVMLLTGLDEKNIKQEISLDILTAFIEGLKLNQIVALIGFYKSLGF